MAKLPIVDGKYRSYMREYFALNKIRDRCLDPNCPLYRHYGGRGIKVCERWLESFENFYEDMGARPTPKHSIDRKDNNGNYSCGKCEECIANGWTANCRWATWQEQASNKRSNKLITFEGKTLTIQGWSRELKIDPKSIHIRYKRGLDIETVLFGMKRLNKQTYVEPAEKLRDIHKRDHPTGPMKNCRICQRERSKRTYHKHKDIECQTCKRKFNYSYIERHYSTKTHQSNQNKEKGRP